MMNEGKMQDEEKSFEVIQDGVPRASVQFDPTQAHPLRKGLTEVSAMFDRTGKGYLDDTERALRRMDSQDKGYLGIDKVCVIFESLQAEQERSSQLLEALRTESKKSLNLRKGVIALSVFTLLLALANVGTSFAVSKLVKDTQVAHGDLMSKATGIRLGTTPKMLVFDMDSLHNADETRRRRLESTAGLICEAQGQTVTNSDGTSNYTKKECSLQGTINVDIADDLHEQLLTQHEVVLTCNLMKSVIQGNRFLPVGKPGDFKMGSGDYEVTYKVFPTYTDINEKYTAVQRVFVSSRPATSNRPQERSRYCDAWFELAIYCDQEKLPDGTLPECLVMTAFLPTDECPTRPVICGDPPRRHPLIN